jgi:hypothetical protein
MTEYEAESLAPRFQLRHHVFRVIVAFPKSNMKIMRVKVEVNYEGPVLR